VEAYAEYAEILREQEYAALAGDLDRLAALGARLNDLEAALGGMPAPPPPSDDDHETSALRREAVEALERASQVQQRLAARLREERDQVRDQIRGLDDRGHQVRSYLDDAVHEGQRLNVRF
jgi:BMFP domain-containing protein YqiC